MPHTYYYILLTYASCSSIHVDGIVLYVVKNIFSLKGVATNHKSTIHLLFVCTWPLLLYFNTNNTAFCHYHFVCAYPVMLNLLVCQIMCYSILFHVADYCFISIRLLNWYGVFYTLVVGNCS